MRAVSFSGSGRSTIRVNILNHFWKTLTHIWFVQKIFTFWYRANEKSIRDLTEWTSVDDWFQWLLLFVCDVNVESADDSDENDHNTVVEEDSNPDFLFDRWRHSTISRDKNVRWKEILDYNTLFLKKITSA